jgi:multiple sugar transport system substrate-binding protein
MVAAMFTLVVFAVFANGSSESASSSTVNLVYAHWGDVNEKVSTQAVVDAFMKENPNLHVKILYIPQSGSPYMQKLNAMAASGTLPDAALFPDTYTLEWGMKGMLLDLSDIYTGVHKKVPAIEYKIPNGKIVGVSGAQETMQIWYSKAIFDKAGLPYPPASGDKAWSWDHFLQVAKELTTDSKGLHPGQAGFNPNDIARYGFNMGLWDMPVITFTRSNGGAWFSDDWKTLKIGDSASIEALQKIGDLINVDHVMPKYGGSATFTTSSALLSGKVAMVMDGQWALETLNKVKKQDGLDFGVAVLPYMKTPVTTATGGPIVAFSTSKHPADAKKLVQFIMDPAQTPEYLTSGLWMPNEERWYHDPQLIAKWIDNANHPPAYRTAVLDYSVKYVTRPLPNFRVPNYPGLLDLLTPALEQIWLGKQTAKQAIDGVMPKLQGYDQQQILPLLNKQ